MKGTIRISLVQFKFHNISNKFENAVTPANFAFAVTKYTFLIFVPFLAFYAL